MASPSLIDNKTAAAPCRLLRLSDELILMVFSFLLPNATKTCRTFRQYEHGKEFLPDLANLAHTCKKLNGIATEYLAKYRKHNPMEEGVFSYMRHLMENDNLARRETIFKLYPSDQNGSLVHGDFERFDKIANELRCMPPSTYPDNFIHAAMDETLFHRRRAALAFLFISQLSNLTSITLHTPATYMLFRGYGRYGRPKRFQLPALNHAKFIGFCSSSCWNWDDVHLDRPFRRRNILPSADIYSFEEYFKAAPNLRRLEFENVEGCNQPVSASRLHSLDLNACRLSNYHMDRFLDFQQATQSLQSFAYRTKSYNNYLQREDVEYWWAELSGHKIVDFIQKNSFGQGQELQTLEIDIRERGCTSRRGNSKRAYAPSPPFLTNLCQFNRLHTVRLTQQTLWEQWFDVFRARPEIEQVRGALRLVHLLPLPLETFSLWDITVEFLPCILSLAEASGSRNRFRHLKSVHLRPSPDFARQLKHAKAHRDDPLLEKRDGCCDVDERALDEVRRILCVFEQESIEADFPFETHPLYTSNKEDLRRQRDLEHWCLECHVEKMGCLEKAGCSEKTESSEKTSSG
ncbi:hypothetical protein F4776DRAFT_672613 [Hypoxylon sp. NC0597]|nr:hypothetical protein F4776DRAFT_672613 [Hypoxylon sp. NC0597]